MTIKYSKIIPFKGFYAITLFGIIYIRYIYKDKPVPNNVKYHECLHDIQTKDFIPNDKNSKAVKIINYIIFYILYGIEYILKLLCKLFYWKIDAYRSVSFEQEAYINEYNFSYHETRKRGSWLKYIFKFKFNK